MDFSEFSEFIGPLIFALIAWLTNYFNKKKKTKEKQPNKIEKQTNNTDDLSIDKIFKNSFQEIKDENEIDQQIDEHLDLEDDKKIEEVIDDKRHIEAINQNKSNEKEKSINRKKKISKLSKGITLSKKLKNKKSLKEAIILKEILDRKY